MENAEVHQGLDAFEMRVLSRTAPLVDGSNFQSAVESLRIDIYMILEARVPESESPSTEPAEDTVMTTLFATVEIPPPPPREHPRGARVERRMGLEHRKRSAVRWRLQGEPRLLMRRRV